MCAAAGLAAELVASSCCCWLQRLMATLLLTLLMLQALLQPALMAPHTGARRVLFSAPTPLLPGSEAGRPRAPAALSRARPEPPAALLPVWPGRELAAVAPRRLFAAWRWRSAGLRRCGEPRARSPVTARPAFHTAALAPAQWRPPRSAGGYRVVRARRRRRSKGEHAGCGRGSASQAAKPLSHIGRLQRAAGHRRRAGVQASTTRSRSAAEPRLRTQALRWLVAVVVEDLVCARCVPDEIRIRARTACAPAARHHDPPPLLLLAAGQAATMV